VPCMSIRSSLLNTSSFSRRCRRHVFARWRPRKPPPYEERARA